MQLSLASCLVILQVVAFAWAQASQAPPSTFPSATTTVAGPLLSSTLSASNSVNASSQVTSATATNSADFPTLSGYSSCVTDCLAMGSSAANCSSLVDVNCFCSNKRFATEIANCISKSCPSEISTAETLAQRFCNVASSSVSLSFPAPTSTRSSNSSAASQSPSNSSPTASATNPPASNTSNAASTKNIGGLDGVPVFYSFVVCIIGAVLGGIMVP